MNDKKGKASCSLLSTFLFEQYREQVCGMHGYKMIYTVTMNPALDYVVKVDHFILGTVNRTMQEAVYYGGKGINVSAILANLGYENRALGFVAGFTGDEIVRGVTALGFETDFIKVKNGISRINMKIKSGKETEINGIGPDITAEDMAVLIKKLECLQKDDMLVLSGSIPKSMGEDIYEKIMKCLDGKEVRVVVDATKNLLLNALPYHPFLIKPNNHELGEMFQTELTCEEDIVEHARKLQEKGAVNVLVSMAEDGAVLLTADGKIYKNTAPKGEIKNSVGAGDSMVAGFIAGYLKYNDYETALKMGVAAGSASAFSDGLAAGEDILKLFQE